VCPGHWLASRVQRSALLAHCAVRMIPYLLPTDLYRPWPETLGLLYSAADVMVVPSRMDNLPHTATEAQSCGVPVVAFNATGLPDVVEHRRTGYLAAPYDPVDLAHGISWVLECKSRQRHLSWASRERAVSTWNEAHIASQYAALYRMVLGDALAHKN
jgi:glycosyltransferase involved in cell wall biosynthesis